MNYMKDECGYIELYGVTWEFNMGFEIASGLKSKKLFFSARRF